MSPPPYIVAVVGVSAGGFNALRLLLGALPAHFALPILIVQHRRPDSGGSLVEIFSQHSRLKIKEADDGEELRPGTVYLAPADYHLLVERNGTLSLSVDAPVRYARPSADVLFESAAAAFGPRVIGIVLTGANDDGSAGLRSIQAAGGTTVVQDPADAEINQMPLNALKSVRPDHVVPLDQIARLLCNLTGCPGSATSKEEP